ncbi:MAG: NAD(P)/FAD-dependent oxidoreductase [Pseudomonadota bacterium]
MNANDDWNHDVIIVGAGAAGIGVAIALIHAGIDDLVVLERNWAGSSFAAWPAETQFITPSFPTNSIGMLDLNSIAIGVSPGYSLQREHPTGHDYAAHLGAIADHFSLPIREQTDVMRIEKEPGGGFSVYTAESVLFAKHVIWAAGEFQYPRTLLFPGSELCQHTATIGSYDDVDGNDIIVIGGYESGIDAAYHLAYRDKMVRVFDRSCPWESTSSDPSITLSPHTLERMQEDWFSEQVELHAYTSIASVEQSDAGYTVTTSVGEQLHTETAPVLAAGFEGSHTLVADLFELREDGYPLLNDRDESTVSPGLFLCGPAVRHDNQVFCFIYKYRQRFAVVAKAIASALGLPAEELETYRLWGMYLDDLSCCGEECVC